MNGASSLLLGVLGPDLLGEAADLLRASTNEDPAEAIVWTVLVGAQLFFKAEHGHNPKVRTLSDAFVYVSTNLSVGYCDIFAMTEQGKRIGTVLMTFGPALAARALDDTGAEKRAAEAAKTAREDLLLAKLDRICDLLSAKAEDPARADAVQKLAAFARGLTRDDPAATMCSTSSPRSGSIWCGSSMVGRSGPTASAACVKMS